MAQQQPPPQRGQQPRRKGGRASRMEVSYADSAVAGVVRRGRPGSAEVAGLELSWRPGLMLAALTPRTRKRLSAARRRHSEESVKRPSTVDGWPGGRPRPARLEGPAIGRYDTPVRLEGPRARMGVRPHTSASTTRPRTPDGAAGMHQRALLFRAGEEQVLANQEAADQRQLERKGFARSAEDSGIWLSHSADDLFAAPPGAGGDAAAAGLAPQPEGGPEPEPELQLGPGLGLEPRPSSGFFAFAKGERRAELLQQQPELSPGELSMRLSQLWKEMPLSERDTYSAGGSRPAVRQVRSAGALGSSGAARRRPEAEPYRRVRYDLQTETWAEERSGRQIRPTGATAEAVPQRRWMAKQVAWAQPHRDARPATSSGIPSSGGLWIGGERLRPAAGAKSPKTPTKRKAKKPADVAVAPTPSTAKTPPRSPSRAVQVPLFAQSPGPFAERGAVPAADGTLK